RITLLPVLVLHPDRFSSSHYTTLFRSAMTYYENTPFRLKLLAIAAAGLNMLVFHFVTGRNVDDWDTERAAPAGGRVAGALRIPIDRKSTRLNSSHVKISYSVFCLKKKN